jgi:nucleoside-diphosphate-sugar epimerase
MRILVTGSEGSLMQSVIPKLISMENEIIGVDNFSRHGVIDRKREYEFFNGDLTDMTFVDAVVKDVDYIIQAAATLYGVRGFHAYPADILSNDVVLHQNILKSALKHNVKKVIYISSSMIYERDNDESLSEKNVANLKIPMTDYGLSKLVGERLSKAFFDQYKLNYTIWRPFNIINSNERAEKEQGFSHVFSDFLDQIVIKSMNPIKIIGDGSQVRCFTWIEDAAKFIAENSFNEITNQKVYNLGNPEPITMKNLAIKIHEKAIARGFVKSESLKFIYTDSPKFDVKVRIPDVSLAENELNWSPKISLDESLEICLDALNMKKAYSNFKHTS